MELELELRKYESAENLLCPQNTLLWTVMMVLVEMSPLREAVQE